MTDSTDRAGADLEPPGRPQDGPFIAMCAAGKYAHCQCRRSARYPFCDGSHRGTDAAPIKVILEDARTVAWCACGGSANPPFCDGSHARTADRA